MQFTSIIAAAGLVAVAAAGSNDTVVFTTEVVTQLTTFCPEATTLTHGTKTYTVTAPTTLTITDCPCTVTKPVYTSQYVSCPSSAAVSTGTVSYPNGTTVVPLQSQTPVVSVPGTGSGSGSGSSPSGSKSATAPSSTIAIGGAGRPAAAGLAGLVGLAAFLF